MTQSNDVRKNVFFLKHASSKERARASETKNFLPNDQTFNMY